MPSLPADIHFGDACAMNDVPSESVHLIVTSPPYNVGKEYEQGMDFTAWKELMNGFISECDRVLVNGGRVCINVASIGRHPYIPLYNYIINIATVIEEWAMRGTILWIKGIGAASSWGSWMQATDPILRDGHEFILVFHKGNGKLHGGDTGISPEEFLEFTRAEWYFQPAPAQEIGHPAPFPDELPRRCILLYSNKGDTVLDPFGGSGTTYKVAMALGRRGIMYEKRAEYAPVIAKRIASPLVIQSDAWKQYQETKRIYPTLVDLSLRELLAMAEHEGVNIAPSSSRYEAMMALASFQASRQNNLGKFIKKRVKKLA